MVEALFSPRGSAIAATTARRNNKQFRDPLSICSRGKRKALERVKHNELFRSNRADAVYCFRSLGISQKLWQKVISPRVNNLCLRVVDAGRPEIRNSKSRARKRALQACAREEITKQRQVVSTFIMRVLDVRRLAMVQCERLHRARPIYIECPPPPSLAVLEKCHAPIRFPIDVSDFPLFSYPSIMLKIELLAIFVGEKIGHKY